MVIPSRICSTFRWSSSFQSGCERDISSTGVYFLCPKELTVGTAIELEIVLVSKPLGRGNVVMATHAHVCRVEAAAMPGWRGVAASFDDVQFDRDDHLPSRFLKP